MTEQKHTPGASPELLEACKRLSGLVQVLRQNRPLADSQGNDLIFASNAIAKATEQKGKVDA